MTIIAKLDFIQLSGAAKLVFCRNIQSKLANTQIFTTPDIPIATITTLIDEYEKALINSKDGSHTATHILSDVEKRLDDMFHLLVYYVNKVAKGNETIIIQSGPGVADPQMSAVVHDRMRARQTRNCGNGKSGGTRWNSGE